MSVQMIYETYLRDLLVQERLALIRLLVEETIEVPETDQAKAYDVLEFAGIGEPYAMQEDAQDYVDKLRSEQTQL